jgi:Fe-S cluster assembly protein SufD
MSLARAIETGDLGQLPSRRDEDWRWTDLRGLLRALPKAAPTRLERIVAPAGEAGVVDRRITAPAGAAQVTRVSIEVAEGGRLTLTEIYDGEGDGVGDTELAIVMGLNSRLERFVCTDNSDDGICVSRAEVTLAAGAALDQTVLTSGARRQRIETRVTHPGAGASVRLDGLYLLAGKRHADITTLVTHAGVGGTTHQLIKGVVGDQARGVFQGRIVVSPGADQTEARMGHHALVLSDRAEVDGKPELEIYADDVVCAHGNTIGALDEDALFYARQRGIPQDEARAMLTEAFVGEVVDRIVHDGARKAARAWVATQLRRVP